MGATTKYYCDFCGEQKNTDELKAIIFRKLSYWVKELRDSNEHICSDCLHAFKKLQRDAKGGDKE